MRDRLLKTLLSLIARLPFRWVGALGAAAGHLIYRRGGREVRIARINLAMCFPEMSEAEREALVRENLSETGRSLAQMLGIWAGPRREWADDVDDNGLMEAAREMIARGRGLIFAMPHLGNWELLAYLATRVAPATALYRPPRQAFMDELMRQGRARSGIEPVPTDRQGLKALHAALQRGEIVGILPDQVPKAAGASGTLAPFFGHPALTMTLVNRLVRRHGCAVLFCCAVYDSNTHRYRAYHFEADPAIGDESSEVAAAALNSAVERCVRTFPAHYQWTYRRFEMPDQRRTGPYARK
ncbi:MAG: lysophospholipid acyltransferase family protein [Chromatiaceae bacterium]|nr:lysophospholipid acyltransferase family protein [Chromatiaceae bacterium]